MREVIRPKDGWSALLPGGEKTAHAIFPYIYLPRWLYYSHLRNKNFFRANAVLAHERQHILDQEMMGVKKWYFWYLISSSFRLQEELKATASEMKVHKKEKIMYDIDFHARSLASSLYLWMISYEDAVRVLDELWRKTPND